MLEIFNTIFTENDDVVFFPLKGAEKEFHQIAVVSGLVINEIMASNVSEVS